MNEYWRQREEQAQREYQLSEDEYIAELNDIYDYMLDQVKKEINSFYTKYLRAEHITYAEATKRVAELDIEEYQRKAKKYVAERDFSPRANQEMRLYNLTMKVNRLELLKAEIGLEMVSGFDEMDKLLKAGLTQEALDEFRRQAGILGVTVRDNAKEAGIIVNASFHNATFSDRIWMYQGRLRDQLSIILQEGLVQGQGAIELGRQIDKIFDVGRYNAERLVRTEMSRVLTESQKQSFIANGFDEYEFMALGTACKICKELDGKHFKIDDMMPGENAPPMHPNCKCTTTSYEDEAEYQEWINSYKDHGLNFNEWKKQRQTTV